MVVSNTLLFSPPLGEMIQFDSYFLDGLKPRTTYELSFEEVPLFVFSSNGHCPRSSGDIEAIRTAIDQAAEAGVSLGASDFSWGSKVPTPMQPPPPARNKGLIADPCHREINGLYNSPLRRPYLLGG